MHFLGSFTLALLAAWPGTFLASRLHAIPADADDWIPIDDPDLRRLPKALQLLPHGSRAAFESRKHPWLLLARRVPDPGEFTQALAQDEQALSKEGSLVPVDEDYLSLLGDEAFFLECDWKRGEDVQRVAALYARASEGELTILWIAAPADASSKRLLAELKSCYREMRESFELQASDTFTGLLNGHEVSFELHSGNGRSAITLESTSDVPELDLAFHEGVVSVNKTFVAAVAHCWRDEERGVSLSMQTFRTDTNLGPESPFVVWLAGQLQTFVRQNEEDGDAPVELIHLEHARTRVVSQEEVDRHYANNKRAPEPGVILKTFVPRSPYSRACRVRFLGKKDQRPALALLVELRAYPRSRSETITRVCAVVLLAHADDSADLVQLEDALGFRCAPLVEPPPLAELPR